MSKSCASAVNASIRYQRRNVTATEAIRREEELRAKIKQFVLPCFYNELRVSCDSCVAIA